MGPLAMTALAGFGGAVSIGWISAQTRPSVKPPVRGQPSARSLAVIAMAFCEGMAILGVVVGLFGIFMHGPIGTGDEAIAAGLPMGGAALGLVLLFSNLSRSDLAVALQASVFIVGLGVLGGVVALLATFIAVAPSGQGSWVYPALGFALLLATGGVAITGARAIEAAQGADAAKTKLIADQVVRRWLAFEVIGFAAFGLGMLGLLVK